MSTAERTPLAGRTREEHRTAVFEEVRRKRSEQQQALRRKSPNPASLARVRSSSNGGATPTAATPEAGSLYPNDSMTSSGSFTSLAGSFDALDSNDATTTTPLANTPTNADAAAASSSSQTRDASLSQRRANVEARVRTAMQRASAARALASSQQPNALQNTSLPRDRKTASTPSCAAAPADGSAAPAAAAATHVHVVLVGDAYAGAKRKFKLPLQGSVASLVHLTAASGDLVCCGERITAATPAARLVELARDAASAIDASVPVEVEVVRRSTAEAQCTAVPQADCDAAVDLVASATTTTDVTFRIFCGDGATTPTHTLRAGEQAQLITVLRTAKLAGALRRNGTNVNMLRTARDLGIAPGGTCDLEFVGWAGSAAPAARARATPVSGSASSAVVEEGYDACLAKQDDVAPTTPIADDAAAGCTAGPATPAPESCSVRHRRTTTTRARETAASSTAATAATHTAGYDGVKPRTRSTKGAAGGGCPCVVA